MNYRFWQANGRNKDKVNNGIGRIENQDNTENNGHFSAYNDYNDKYPCNQEDIDDIENIVVQEIDNLREMQTELITRMGKLELDNKLLRDQLAEQRELMRSIQSETYEVFSSELTAKLAAALSPILELLGKEIESKNQFIMRMLEKSFDESRVKTELINTMRTSQEVAHARIDAMELRGTGSNDKESHTWDKKPTAAVEKYLSRKDPKRLPG